MGNFDRVMVGEALVGEGNEVAHIDLIMGPRGSAVETAFCNTITNQKVGDNALLALVAPNLMAKPATLMFNKVTIQTGEQATQMFGPAQRGVAKAVVDSVKAGIIPRDEAENLFICVGVFIHWEAKDDAKIQDWNYEATKQAISRAVNGEPKIAEVIAEEDVKLHPLAAHA
ncbi:MAG TPA: formaldehyde-activating enzyme [Methylovirgula sp.]|nr:formaldehyde-activating enzyme [Methylovirgula sp.]